MEHNHHIHTCSCGHEHGHCKDGSRKITLVRIIISGIILAAGVFLRKYEIAFAILAVLAFSVAGYDIVMAVVRKFLHFSLKKLFDEEFLMLLASVGAFVLGEYPEAVIIMLFYQIGELFQDAAVEKSRDTIKKLMDIRPDYANIKNADGTLKKVSPESVSAGDIIVIKPGEKIPLDGTVTEGEAFLNTAALTGESLPREVRTGDSVLSGSLNTNGLLTVKVQGTYSESTAAKILALIETDDKNKANSEKFINKFAAVYTPIMLILAVLIAVVPPLLTGQMNFAEWAERAIILLVISCPCALVISVPLAFFGGIGNASSKGILVKGSACLERLAKVGAVAFDKTGTLTEGELEVQDIIPYADMDKDTLLLLAASAEKNSTHPVALAVVNEFEGSGAEFAQVFDFEEKAGNGVSVHMDVNGKNVHVLAGNARLMASYGVEVKQQKTACIHIAADGKYAGCICVADKIKPESYEVAKQLENAGIYTLILTGDGESAADEVAKELNMPVKSELLPADKVAAVKELMQEHVTAFAGDGINDAPVLACADIGIAMGAIGSDSAIEIADTVIMDDDPRKIYKATQIARKTLAVAKQNIVFSLLVKGIVMVLGILNLSGMYLAVFADVGVSVLAIINSMRTMRK